MVTQAVLEKQVDVVLISEPNSNPGNWIMGDKGKAAIWSTGLNKIANFEDRNKATVDYAAICVSKTTIISIYISPGIPIEQYAYKVKEIAKFIKEERKRGNSIIVGGDWNARSPVWGSDIQNQKGTIVLDELSKCGMYPIKPIGKCTFQRKNATSIIDFLATSADLQRREEIKTRILKDETASDHKYLLTNININNKHIPRQKNWNSRWKITEINSIRLQLTLRRKLSEEGLNYSNCFSHTEEKKFIDLIREACIISLDEKEEKTEHRKQNIWWNKELAESRKKLQRLRRARQRANKKGKWDEAEVLDYLFKKEKRTMTKKITNAKKEKWNELCETINGDIWGKPYKIVLKSVKNATPPAILSPEFAGIVLHSLFPQEEEVRIEATQEIERGKDQRRKKEVTPRSEDDSQGTWKVSREEILLAAKHIKAATAAGLDRTSPEIVKVIANFIPDRIAALFTGIIRRGEIPVEWKQSRAILLRKQGKDPETPSAYRPICIINAMAKLLEYVIKGKIMEELGESPFEQNQYGFVKGKSTVQAMHEVKKEMLESIKKQKFAAIMALDVKNAFNSLKWNSIYEELIRRKFPDYLVRLIKNYFHDRTIEYFTAGTIVSLKMKRGVPQGSVLGPLLCNLVYDGLLRIKNPRNCKKVAFADDIILISTSTRLQAIKRDMEKMAEETNTWMRTVGLELAEQKTEAMFLNKKGIPENFAFKIGSTEISPRKVVKYLGVTFGVGKYFYEHTENVTNKAIRTMCALSRLMGNTMGTSSGARKLYYLVMESIVLYGIPIWEEASKLNKNAKLLRKTQRMGLARVISAYRSVSLDAMNVLAGIVPWDIKAEERRDIFKWENAILGTQSEEIYQTSQNNSRRQRIEEELERNEDGNNNAEDDSDPEGPGPPHPEDFRDRGETKTEEESRKKLIKNEIRKKAKEKTRRKWQRKWDKGNAGRWTHTCIPKIEPWIDRKHGQLNFYMTQVLTGHGVFNFFRKRIGKTADDSCWFHPGVTDTPEHTVICCDEWQEPRSRLARKLEVPEEEFRMEKIMEAILESEAKWNAMADFCKEVMKEKEEMERVREKENLDNPIGLELEADMETGLLPRRLNDV